MTHRDAYPEGATVQKIKGYKLPGVIVSVFKNTKGQTRYVVECTVPEVAGLLHIYSHKDIRRTFKEPKYGEK